MPVASGNLKRRKALGRIASVLIFTRIDGLDKIGRARSRRGFECWHGPQDSADFRGRRSWRGRSSAARPTDGRPRWPVGITARDPPYGHFKRRGIRQNAFGRLMGRDRRGRCTRRR
jgi:hypothetical protein